MIIDNNQAMLSNEDIIMLATELVDAIDNGSLMNNECTEKYTYAHLISMFYATDAMDDGKKLFEFCFDTTIKCGLESVKRKLSCGEKLKVAFLPISASEWPAEILYKRMVEDERFEPVIIPVPVIGRIKEDRGRLYDQTYDFFRDNGYNVVKVYNSETEEIGDWDVAGGKPDIAVQVTPWYLDMAQPFQISNLPLSTLDVFISYGLSVGNSAEGDFDKLCQYNKEFMNLCWKVYTESQKDYEGFLKYQIIKGKNVKNSGYVKMDYFYTDHSYSEEEIASMWKTPEGRKISSYKKVLITPHFSVRDSNCLAFSTFADNMYFWPIII